MIIAVKSNRSRYSREFVLLCGILELEAVSFLFMHFIVRKEIKTVV